MFDTHCRQCGTYVGRTDEFGYCKECRRVHENLMMMEEVKKPFKIRFDGYIP